MADLDAHYNLLFGLLALQTGMIDQGTLFTAFNAWSRARDRPMADVLVGLGKLDVDERSAVEAMVALHLKKHGGDAEKSLAAVNVGRSTLQSLAGLAGPELTRSVALLPTPRKTVEGLDDPAATVTVTVGSPTSDGQRFRLLRPLAKGGLGEVFVALDGELNREVALKQILGHHADEEISRTRFLIEAEITGGLEHPGIVPVYGLGQYADGRPYYAMRFIRGDTLKEAIAAFHADESARRNTGRRSLALRDLLRRFVDVCNAIDYAHERGIIHRDLKPSNVIVGKHGETFVVDWGLAKPVGKIESGTASEERMLRPSSASGSAETLPGSALGTPSYMSPEQASGNLEHIGVRSDVYSLGATLYSVLTGKAPFEGDVGGVLRDVQKGNFPPPRSVDPSIDPALEAVCLKAMANRIEDRYPSSRSLAEDVERWTADEPVTAYRDGLPVRLGRWARKHRTAVAVAAGLLQTAVVVLGVAAVLLGQSRARVERERRVATRERDRAEAVNHFLIDDLLKQADPNNNPVGDKLTVRELLDKAAKAVDANASLAGRPEVEGAIRTAIGSTYLHLSLYDSAVAQLEKAARCLANAPNVQPAQRIYTQNQLNSAYYRQGRFNTYSGMTGALELARQELGEDHEETIVAANNLAALLLTNMYFDRALPMYRQILEVRRRHLGPDHELTLRAAYNLSSALLNEYDKKANLVEAESILRETVASYRKAGRVDYTEAVYAEDSLGLALVRQGKFSEALALLEPQQVRCVKVFGPDHVENANLFENLGLANEGLGRLDGARSLFQKALAVRRTRMKDTQPFIRRNLYYLARVELDRGDPQAAAAWIGEAYANTDRATQFKGLEGALAGSGDPKENLAVLDNLRREVRIQFGSHNWVYDHITGLRGAALLGSGDALEVRLFAEGTMRNVASIVPKPGTKLISVSSQEKLLHFRTFDAAGKLIVDTDETKLPDQVARIAELKAMLGSLWDVRPLSDQDKERVETAVGSIVGETPGYKTVALQEMRAAISGMEQDTTTPPRYLAEARARLLAAEKILAADKAR